MLVDFYELTMSNGYFEQGCGDRLTVFDMFFRNFPMVTDSPSVPTRSSSLTMVKNLHFTKENTDSLRSKKIFHEKISGISGGLSFQRRYLGHAGGNADVPGEPAVTVVAPAIEARLIETIVLLTVNFQSLAAAKANRIVRAAQATLCGTRSSDSRTPTGTFRSLLEQII